MPPWLGRWEGLKLPAIDTVGFDRVSYGYGHSVLHRQAIRRRLDLSKMSASRRSGCSFEASTSNRVQKGTL